MYLLSFSRGARDWRVPLDNTKKGIVMHKFSLTLAATAFALALSPALAQTTTAQSSTAAAASTSSSTETSQPGTTSQTSSTTNAASTNTASNGEDPNAVVCKFEGAATGSRIGTREICKTNAQWDSLQHQTQQDFTTYQMSHTSVGGPNSAGTMGH
jgi:hypothetical protein